VRIRSVKPEFWRSADTAQLSLFARLLFIGLWNYVDDSGVGDYDEALIRSDLFPRDPVTETAVMIHGAITELYRMGQITLYEDSSTGRRYIHIVNWHHQVINRPTQSKKPPPTSDFVRLIEPSLPPHVPLTEDSLPEQGNKGTREQGNEGAGEREGGTALEPVSSVVAIAPTASKKGTRLPDAWMPSGETVRQIRAEFPWLTKENLEAEHRSFVDWAHSSSSRNAVKKDWDATWRNWMRREFKNATPSRPNNDDKVNEWADRGQRLAERISDAEYTE